MTNASYETEAKMSNEASGEPDVIDLRTRPSVLKPNLLDVTIDPISDFSEEFDDAERQLEMATRYDMEALAPVSVREIAQVMFGRDELLRDNGKSLDKSPDVVNLFEAQRYVEDAPLFNEQVADESRTMPFRYYVKPDVFRNMTEHEGLMQLDTFLMTFINDVRTAPQDHLRRIRPDLIDKLLGQAESMRESLTFIGWPEYQKAAKGLGERWRSFLDENPDNQLCILAEVGNFERYKRFDNRKSDDLVREDVLLTFTDEELTRYRDRIVGSLDDITQLPATTKIIMVDDWTISGRQMRELYYNVILAHPIGAEVAATEGVEINLLTASRSRLQDGLLLDPHKPQKGNIPVFAYYKSHEAPGASYAESAGHVTGQHSAVNYDFYDSLVGMFKLHRGLGGPRRQRIALARIEPWYRTTEPVIVASGGRLTKVNHGGEAYEQRRNA